MYRHFKRVRSESSFASGFRDQKVLTLFVLVLVVAYIGLSIRQNAVIGPALASTAMQAVTALDMVMGKGTMVVTKESFQLDMEQYLLLLSQEGMNLEDVQAVADYLDNQELTESFMLAFTAAYRLHDYSVAFRQTARPTNQERKMDDLIFSLTALAVEFQARPADGQTYVYELTSGSNTTPNRKKEVEMIQGKTMQQIEAEFARLRANCQIMVASA